MKNLKQNIGTIALVFAIIGIIPACYWAVNFLQSQAIDYRVLFVGLPFVCLGTFLARMKP